MPNSASYDSFAYHTEFLKEFSPKDPEEGEQRRKSSQFPASPNRNEKLQKGVSEFQIGSIKKKNTDSQDDEDNFNIAISLHGKVPTNVTPKRGTGMSRAKSCAIGI